MTSEIASRVDQRIISVGDMPVGVLLDEAIIVPAHDNNLRRQRENSLYHCIIGFGRRGTAVRIALDDGIGDGVIRWRRSIFVYDTLLSPQLEQLSAVDRPSLLCCTGMQLDTCREKKTSGT